MPVKTILYPQKIPSIYCKVILDLITDIIELNYNSDFKIYNSKVNLNVCEVTLLLSSAI